MNISAPQPHDTRQAIAERRSDVVPRFYSVAQVARMFGMSTMTVYRAIAAGEFPAVRIRGRLIVPAKAVDAMVDAAMTDRAVVDAADWVAVPGRGTAGGVA